MNTIELENLRLAILKVAAANQTRFGQSVTALQLNVSTVYACDASASEVRREAEYLEEKGLLKNVTKTVSPENRYWLITAHGRDFLAEREA